MPEERCCLVVDSGFSFTHFVPYVQGKILFILESFIVFFFQSASLQARGFAVLCEDWMWEESY